jgi:hypothetical protein
MIGSCEYDSQLSNAGCIVTDNDGKVKMIADKNFIVDLNKIDSYNINIDLQLLKTSNRIINNCYKLFANDFGSMGNFVY